MAKLVSKFLAEPTEANRFKLAAYVRKHPMAGCCLSTDEVAQLRALGVEV